jgi:hypothetical protein
LALRWGRRGRWSVGCGRKVALEGVQGDGVWVWRVGVARYGKEW